MCKYFFTPVWVAGLVAILLIASTVSAGGPTPTPTPTPTQLHNRHVHVSEEIYTVEEQKTQPPHERDTHNIIHRLIKRVADAVVAPKYGNINSIMKAIAVDNPQAAAAPSTVTITTTVTGLVPSIVDPESLMDAIKAQLGNQAATKTITIFTTIGDGDGDGDGELSDIESDFNLVDMSQNEDPSETDARTTPCNSVMTLGSMTITLPTQLQCPIIDENNDMGSSSSDSGDVELATPEPTSDAPELGGLDSMQESDEPCFSVITVGSIAVTFTNKNSVCASYAVTNSGGDSGDSGDSGGEDSSPLPTEPEPTIDSPSDESPTDESSTDESSTESFSESITETDSLSDSELHSLDEPTSEIFSNSESSANVAKPVMGSLGFGIYQTNDEFLTCRATPSA